MIKNNESLFFINIETPKISNKVWKNNPVVNPKTVLIPDNFPLLILL